MIQTTVVGSYPAPTWLKLVSNREALRDAMLAVIKSQELCGIELLADGELYRWDVDHAETNGMIDYFVRPLQGIESVLTAEQLRAWRARPELQFRGKPAGAVTGPLGAGRLDLGAAWRSFAELTERRRKFTVTSPFMLARVLHDAHYGDDEALVLALADLLAEQLSEVDADVVQVDEAFVTGDPQSAGLAAAGINRVLSGVRGEKHVHLCFGNYGGQTIQQGHYRRLIAFLNTLEADCVILEVARRPDEELELLKGVRPELGLGIGVIDVKDTEIETPELVARRIERAARQLGPDRIRYVHPDCGFWMLQRHCADGKMRALVAGRDLFSGARAD